jgi:hypothetical protein
MKLRDCAESRNFYKPATNNANSMVELYVSWVKGLSKNKKALSIIKQSPFISGVEMFNADEDIALFKAAGLKVSIHNPIKPFHIGLIDKNMVPLLKERKNSYLIKAIMSSDAKVIGFHTYSKVLQIEAHAMKGEPLDNQSYEIRNEGEVRESVIENLLCLEHEINKSLADDKEKKILFETYPYANFNRIKEKKNVLSKECLTFLKKAGMLNRPEFLRSVFEDERIKSNDNIGFLFDIAHVFVAINNLVNDGEIKANRDECIKEIIDVTRGRVYQLHLSAPRNFGDNVYVDKQEKLVKGGEDSMMMLRIAKEVLKNNPLLQTISLEIDTHLDPVSHAKELVAQAELVAKELNLEKK